MAYLTFLTAARHQLMVDPRRQKVMFRDIQDAVLAEACVGQRGVSYNRYRISRGATGDCRYAISISLSAKKQLEMRDARAFQRIDAGIMNLEKRPTAASTKPKYYRWFIGDLRRVLVDEFPIFYSFDEERERLTILLFGLPRWKRAPKAVLRDLKTKRPAQSAACAICMQHPKSKADGGTPVLRKG